MIKTVIIVVCVMSRTVIGSSLSPEPSTSLISNDFFTVPSGMTQITPIFDLMKSGMLSSVPAMISDDGPISPPLPVVHAPPITLPTIESPIISLPSPPIPAPRVLAQRCICTKTVIKPQIIQRQITIPRIQRYLKRTYTPVIENIAYKAKPLPLCRSSSSSTKSNACTSSSKCSNSKTC